jgi:L-asparaginase
MGVLSGADMTAESAITKAMFVLAMTEDKNERKRLLETSLRGEMTT